MQANRQWAERPADERFQSLSDMHSSIAKRDGVSTDGKVRMSQVGLHVNGDITMVGSTRKARFTHWSAGQMLSKLGVPRDLLAKLSPEVATSVLMDRLPAALKEGVIDERQRMLLQNVGEGTDVIRAFHGSRYERLWDKQVTGMLMEYLPPGWRNPVAFDKGKWGAPLVPSGLYAGDRDMFAVFIDGGDWAPGQATAGSFDVDGDAFHRGFMTWNSEVGAQSFGFMPFNFRVICGNNIIWGAENVQVFKARHAGGAHDIFKGLRRFLTTLNESTNADNFVVAVRDAKDTIAISLKGASTSMGRERILDEAFGKFKGKFTQTVITDSLDAILREEKGAKGTRWDWLQGFTSVARTTVNADERTKIETTASKLLLATR
jgi:hypothetical protein